MTKSKSRSVAREVTSSAVYTKFGDRVTFRQKIVEINMVDILRNWISTKIVKLFTQEGFWGSVSQKNRLKARK